MIVEKTLFVLYGTCGTGKTTTITKACELLARLPDATKTECKCDGPDFTCDGPDFTCIVKVGGTRIGIVSDSDVPGNVENAIKCFQKKCCNIIICACRTRSTKGSAREYINTICEEHNCYWFRTSSICNDRWSDDEKEKVCKAYNHGTAKVIVDMIKSQINAD